MPTTAVRSPRSKPRKRRLTSFRTGVAVFQCGRGKSGRGSTTEPLRATLFLTMGRVLAGFVPGGAIIGMQVSQTMAMGLPAGLGATRTARPSGARVTATVSTIGAASDPPMRAVRGPPLRTLCRRLPRQHQASHPRRQPLPRQHHPPLSDSVRAWTRRGRRYSACRPPLPPPQRTGTATLSPTRRQQKPHARAMGRCSPLQRSCAPRWRTARSGATLGGLLADPYSIPCSIEPAAAQVFSTRPPM